MFRKVGLIVICAVKAYLVAILLFSLAPATTLHGAETTHSDQAAQMGLDEVFQNNTAQLDRVRESFKLNPPLDITKTYENGDLVARAEALAPLVPVLPPNTSQPTGGITKSPKAFVAMATLWRPQNSSAFVSPSGRLTIFVCWLNPSASNSRGRAITQQAIEATWEYHGPVQFVGWKECKPDSKGIKITIADVRPWSAYGVQAESATPSMTLNFTFNDPQMAGCKAISDLCIWSIAVHEFGHALGFIHEQDSANTPDWCVRQLGPGNIQAPDAALQAKLLTDWDEFSVMDYCFDIYKQRVQLSDCDIAAYRKLYGDPPSPAYQPRCVTR
jgi:hypothetical protein